MISNRRYILDEFRKQKVEELYVFFLKDLDVDIIEKRRNNLLTEYRSLFNKLLARKHKLTLSQIIDFYKSKGVNYEHGTIINSISKFKKYSYEIPELNFLYNKIHSNFSVRKSTSVTLDKRELTPIQKLVDNLTLAQEKELTELIILRKKSWEWKSKDRLTVYTSN